MRISSRLSAVASRLRSFVRKYRVYIIAVLFLLFLGGMALAYKQLIYKHDQVAAQLRSETATIQQELQETTTKLTELENTDQKLRNDELQGQLKDLQDANTQAVTEYERLLQLQEDGAKIAAFQERWAEILAQLGKHDYASASAILAELRGAITTEQQRLAQVAALNIPQAPVNNQAPSAGYQRQTVETSAGSIVVSSVAGDLGSTRVVVDTASDKDCKNDCPALALGDYVSRNGAFAGVNGSYFCPVDYPSCADKKNSFDLLAMNKQKTYFNSENNVYSSNPAVIFQGGSVRFVSAASQWGRDTGVDGVLSNYPLLVSGGSVVFGGDGDPKKGSKSNRGFVASKGSTVYIGVVHGATVAEAAIALQALGMEHAMNLDGGGSTALWASGYKVGPGRAIPNAILFVRK